ncbi:MAG: hypothetical protein QHJ73_03175, partial [Armatimonadota bacterium]|nr:hypothetical protein [Armatimonadota bacterium]
MAPCSRASEQPAVPSPAAAPELIRFAPPWTSPYRVDPVYPYHLINGEGERLFLFCKTAWAFFACRNPSDVLARAGAQGVNVIRVALEGTPYHAALGLDLWPWGGTRQHPEFTSFNQPYWDEVEARTRLAGEMGIGLDVVLYFSLRPTPAQVDEQRPYWEEALRRLGRYANVLTWEIQNEYIANEAFQDAAGAFFARHDPFGRPVCTSDGT